MTFQRLHDKSMPRPEKRPQDAWQECTLSLLCFHPSLFFFNALIPFLSCFFMLSSVFATRSFPYPVFSLALLPSLPFSVEPLEHWTDVFCSRIRLVHVLAWIQCCWPHFAGNTHGKGHLERVTKDQVKEAQEKGSLLLAWRSETGTKWLWQKAWGLQSFPTSSCPREQHSASSSTSNSSVELLLQMSDTGNYACHEKGFKTFLAIYLAATEHSAGPHEKSSTTDTNSTMLL